MYPRLFQFGPISIPTAGAFAAIGILAALFATRITARRLELDPEKIWDLGITGILTALVAPRLILIFSNWKDFTAHPLWLIGVFSVRSDSAVVGGLALALTAMLVFALATRLPLRSTLDALAPGFALGLAIASIGEFLAGSAFGTPTRLPWAITYKSRLASLWYGTPLGTPLHPVQIYSAFVECCILVLLLNLIAKRDTWKIRSGEVMGAWLFLYATSSSCMNLLRSDLPANSFFASQSLAAGMALVGGLLWLF